MQIIKHILSSVVTYIVLIIFILLSILYLTYKATLFSEDKIKETVVSNAILQFENMVNTRKWNASYGGVYVYGDDKIEPNPYLKNNHIFDKNDNRMIKINPAWMTRQLSEIENIENFSFKIVSRNPLNKKNIANQFEKSGLDILEKESGKKYYYNFDTTNKEFKFIGELRVAKACMPCHKEQGYKIGDLRGGISIYKDISSQIEQIDNINQKRDIVSIVSVLISLLIIYLTIKIFDSNKKLHKKVKERTKELEEKSNYLERVKNSNNDILIVTNGESLKDGNLAFLRFFDKDNIEEFKKYNDCICDFFEEVDQDEYIYNAIIEDKPWVKYILDNQDISFKVMMSDSNGYKHIFLITAEYLLDSDSKDVLVVFSDITSLENSKNRLEYLCNIDELTQIMNRKRFNKVIEDEIISINSMETDTISLIFFDIDHFKDINDTYGHDAGDRVLVELSELIKSSIRADDFFARWGGEEFIIVVRVDKKRATLLAEKLREKVEEYNFSIDRKVTCSFGVTEYKKPDTKDSMIKRVDEALYKAKNSGRNIVNSL
jgi:diguanylate cyclase (GGDEF)-like protein